MPPADIRERVALISAAPEKSPPGAAPDQSSSAVAPSPFDGLVHYEDADLLALEKPAGLLAVPGRGEDKADCLFARAKMRWTDALVVHRLDQATSGLMLLARNIDVQRRLSADFAERRVHKRYEAIVHGHVSPPLTEDQWGNIDLPLLLDWPNRPRSKVEHNGGKPSHTRWKIASHDAQHGTTRLLLEPLTGRSHQLRVHLLALGHPIVGDALYGPADGAARLMLHASELRISLPSSGGQLDFVSKVPF